MNDLFGAPQLHDHVPAGKVDTSQAAFERVARFARTGDQRRVLRYIYESAGMGATCDEAEVALGLSHQTASARYNDLMRAGLITRGGWQRPTRTGSKAHVYVLSQRALDALDGDAPGAQGALL